MAESAVRQRYQIATTGKGFKHGGKVRAMPSSMPCSGMPMSRGGPVKGHGDVGGKRKR